MSKYMQSNQEKAIAKINNDERQSSSIPSLVRNHFQTSRVLDFFSRKELIAQTGHQASEWPLVCQKELVDNALDACEESGVQPVISIVVDDTGLTVSDNGPGIPPSVIDAVVDYTTKVSSREAYVSPCRGAQGNALQTILAMPFVLSGRGSVLIEAQGVCHRISISVDRIRQQPKIDYQKSEIGCAIGTKITVSWPDLARLAPDQKLHFLQNDDPSSSKNDGFSHDTARLILDAAKARFLQIADDYSWINPHLNIDVRWGDINLRAISSNPTWEKWLPSNPTDPNWYSAEDFRRLIAANICHNPTKMVRELLAEFRGLSGTAKQKHILESVGLSRSRLSDLVTAGDIDDRKLNSLLYLMKELTLPVKAQSLGVIGKEHLLSRCELAGGDPKSFQYTKVLGSDNGVPWVIEACFAYCPAEKKLRRIVTGVNWSPSIKNPFRQLGKIGKSLDSILEEQRVGMEEPTIVVLHIACPKVAFADRGKSSIIVEN